MNNRFNTRRDHRTSILPMGKVNIITGENELFNIYDTWGKDENQTAEIWKVPSGSYILIFSAGPFNREAGDVRDFKHDQTGRPLFGDACLTFVKEYNLKDLKDAAPEFGKSLRGYVYK